MNKPIIDKKKKKTKTKRGGVFTIHHLAKHYLLQ
jgi:hypothetical protein